MQPIVVELTKGKETRGTHRYESEDTADVPITTLYIKKTAFADGQVPHSVRLTVEPLD